MAREDEVVARLQAKLARISGGAARAAGDAWDSLGSWDKADIARLEELSIRIWSAGRQATVPAASSAYSVTAGTSTVAVPLDSVAGVPPATAGAFRVMWKHLADGAQWVDAHGSGRSAFQAQHADAVMQASRHTGDAWASVAGYRGGWKRILTGASCEWCALVSTQIYRSADSASFGHDRCDCTVAPVGDSAEGRVVNRPLYDELRRRDVAGKVGRNRNTSSALRSADEAQQRSMEAMTEAARETDPARKSQLIDRARKADREAQRYRVMAAEGAARQPGSPDGSTGYVTPDGRLAPRPSP